MKTGRTINLSEAALRPVSTLGEALVAQLKSKDNFPQGLESLVEIASNLPPKKQFEFLEAMIKETKFFDIHKLNTIYNPYRTLENAFILAEEEKKSGAMEDLEKKLKKAKSALPFKLKNKTGEEDKFQIYPELKRYLLANPNSLRKEKWQPIVEALLKAPGKQRTLKDSKGKEINLFNSPLYQVIGSVPDNPAVPTKLDLEEVFKQTPEMEYSLFAGPKGGGKNKPGKFGAEYIRCYLDSENRIQTQRMLTKQATDDGKPNFREVIAEVLGSGIASYIGGYEVGATYLSLRPGGRKGVAEDAYMSSIYFDEPTMVHEAVHKILPEYQGNEGKKIPKRPGGIYAGQSIDNTVFGVPDFRRGCRELWKTGIEKTSFSRGMMAAYAVGNTQNHAENIVTTPMPSTTANDQKVEAFGIFDFGGAFRRKFTFKSESGRRFSRSIRPEKISDKKLGVAYLAAYPKEVLRSKEYFEGIEAACAQSKVGLANYINQRIDYVVSFFGAEVFVKKFAAKLDLKNKRLNPKTPTPEALKSAIEETKNFLTNTITARLYSLRDYGLRAKQEQRLKSLRQGDKPLYERNDLIKDYPFSFILSKGSDIDDCNLFASEGDVNEFFFKELNLTEMTGAGAKADSIASLITDFEYILQRTIDYITPLIAEDDPDELEDLINDSPAEPKPLKINALTELQALKNFLHAAIHDTPPCDLSDKDEQRIIAQAFNDGFQQIKAIYEMEPNKSYFLDSISSRYTHNAGPLINTDTQASLIAAQEAKGTDLSLDETIYLTLRGEPSADLIQSSDELLDRCNPSSIMTAINSAKLKIDKYDDLPQDQNNPVKNTYIDFMKDFYKETASYSFREGEPQPWIIQILGRGTTEELANSDEQEKSYLGIFLAISQLKKQALEEASKNDPEKQSFLDIGIKLIDEHNEKIIFYTEELSKLIQLNNKRHLDVDTRNDIAEATDQFYAKFTTLLDNPWDVDQPLAAIQAKVSELQDQSNKDHPHNSSIIEETVVKRKQALTSRHNSFQPKAPAATLHSSPNPAIQQSGEPKLLQYTFKMAGNSSASMEIQQYHSKGNSIPTSDLQKVDSSIDTLQLFTKIARDHLPHVEAFKQFKDAKDLFETVLEKIEDHDHEINLSTLNKALASQLKTVAPQDVMELATLLHNSYLLNFEQLDASGEANNPFHYPSDLLIRMAYNQIQAYKEETNQHNPTITINEAWDPHYAEALILVCKLENCPVKNNSNWHNFDKLDEKLKHFKDFFENRYDKDLNLDHQPPEKMMRP